jgi:hypothetical protein
VQNGYADNISVGCKMDTLTDTLIISLLVQNGYTNNISIGCKNGYTNNISIGLH